MERIPLGALTLSRRVGQGVVILDADGTLIGVVSVNAAAHGKASLCFQFPRALKVLREELPVAQLHQERNSNREYDNDHAASVGNVSSPPAS